MLQAKAKGTKGTKAEDEASEDEDMMLQGSEHETSQDEEEDADEGNESEPAQKPERSSVKRALLRQEVPAAKKQKSSSTKVSPVHAFLCA